MPDPVDVHVGNAIRLLRQQQAMSQMTLAHKVGITFQQIQKYEKGANRVSASRLVQIANVLDAEVSVFFNGVQSPGPNNDNLLPRELMTRQGLALLKAFHGIDDVLLRNKIIQFVQTVSERKSEQENDPPRRRKAEGE